jgi:DNA polymerase IV
MEFNRAPSTIMHLDLNSCFASIEQQANPSLRGRPVAVAAYNSPRGCILAASTEAKKMGVKTGLRVREGKALCPDLIVLPTDADKYRFVHHSLKDLLAFYTPALVPKSIDEFVLDFANCQSSDLFKVGQEIKQKIRQQIGDWLTVSIGLGPSRFLAKVASNLIKPDGLEEINSHNYLDVYSRLKLLDLHGINTHLCARLNAGQIYTVMDFLTSDICHLRSIFHSVNSYYWYLRLRGYEIDNVDFGRKSFGNMYSLPQPIATPDSLSPILHKLVAKTTFRLRTQGYHARGFYLGLLFTDHSFWHQHYSLRRFLFHETDIYQIFFRLLRHSPQDKKIANIAISCFDLLRDHTIQLDLFNTVSRHLNLSRAMDSINHKYGIFVISPGAMLRTESLVPDRIGFGNIDPLTSL